MVFACQPRIEQQTTQPTLFRVSPIATENLLSVRLSLDQEVYHRGEVIHFQVTNRLEIPIYYIYGCGWPNPHKLESGEWIGLTVSIIEEYPPAMQIAPGESKDCYWDQMVWQNPSQIGRARYQSYVNSELVPTGQYKLVFFYYRNEAEVGYGDQAIAVWSRPITIQ
jgi:hypothetical protein